MLTQIYSGEALASSGSSLAVTTSQRHWPFSLDGTLFFLAALVFLATRLIGLDRWPIYFFSDEAINPIQALNFLRHGLSNGAGEFFPTYFAKYFARRIVTRSAACSRIAKGDGLTAAS